MSEQNTGENKEPRPLLFTPADDPVDLVAEWTERPELREVVEAFGGNWPAGVTLEAQLADLVSFSTVWDHRRGGSRLDIAEVEGHADDRYSMVPRVADALGLVNQPTPSRDDPDQVVILGGLVTGNLARIEYYEHLAQQEGLKPSKALVLLGSFRRLAERETAFLLQHRPDLANAETEVTMLLQEANREFPREAPWHEALDGDPITDPNRASLHTWAEGSPAIHVFAAASSEPDLRPANTADTLRYAAELLPISKGAYVQLLTSGIYSVYQFFESVRVLGLGYRVSVEVIGVPPGRALRQQNTASQTQEIRSCLRAALALVRTSRSM